MLAVENIGESILLCQNFTHQSFNVHMILSCDVIKLKVWDSVNLAVKVSELDLFDRCVDFKIRRCLIQLVLSARRYLQRQRLLKWKNSHLNTPAHACKVHVWSYAKFILKKHIDKCQHFLPVMFRYL